MAWNRAIHDLQDKSLPAQLLSPSPSIASTATPGELPRSREHPLKPGSQKEVAFINFVDHKMLNISRRYVKKFSSDAHSHEGVGKGYDTFKEVVQDLEAVFDIVWVSGTPTLQIPYLLSLASSLVSYMPAFSFSAKATIRMVRKLDLAFTHLLQLDDSANLASLHTTHSTLSDKQQRIVSPTSRVRIKSICESTRVCVVEQRQKGDIIQEDEPSESESEDDEADFDMGSRGLQRRSQGNFTRGIGSLYEATLSMLGDTLASAAPLTQDIDLDVPMSTTFDGIDDMEE